MRLAVPSSRVSPANRLLDASATPVAKAADDRQDAVRTELRDQRVELAATPQHGKNAGQIHYTIQYGDSGDVGRWIKVASAYPSSPTSRNTRGINGTDWIRIDRATYEDCIDARDYRPKARSGRSTRA